MDGPGTWLSLAELAERSGRDRAAVRSWVRRRLKAGQARTQRNNRGETQVWATPELLADLGQDRDPDRDHADGQAEVWSLEEVATLRHALGRAEGELAAELRRNADLAATLAVERSRADRLEATLAEARRPLLLRLLDGLRRKES